MATASDALPAATSSFVQFIENHYSCITRSEVCPHALCKRVGVTEMVLLTVAQHHPHIVPLTRLGPPASPEAPWEVETPIARGRDLITFLTVDIRRLPRGCRAACLDRISRQAIAAVRFIHDCGIFHLDIKVDNLLLAQTVKSAEDVHMWLTDFGAARTAREELRILQHACCRGNKAAHKAIDQRFKAFGSRYILPGEAWSTDWHIATDRASRDEQEQALRAVDVWMVGILLFAIWTGHASPIRPKQLRVCWAQQQPEILAARVKYFVHDNNDIPFVWQAAILSCLQLRAKDRPRTLHDLDLGEGDATVT